VEQDVITIVIEWLQKSAKIVIFTGNELTLDSGIPDFTDSRLNPNIRDFRENPDVRETYWAKVSEVYPVLVEFTPCSAHQSIAELEMLCSVDCILTQATDGLHHRAGSTSVIELCGTMHWITCTSCGKHYRTEYILSLLGNEIKIPCCEACGKDLLKPPISFPGQPLPHWELREAWMRLHNCELFLITGAILDNSPFSSLQTLATENGAKIVIINSQETEADKYADAVLYGDPNVVLPHLVNRIKTKVKVS
jgi:NAD-dependent deacetylase